MRVPRLHASRLFPALALAASVASCSGGGGDISLFFGVNGKGDCRRVIVDIDLDAAGATLARDVHGAADCVISSLLAQHGCSATFDEIGPGNSLRVTLDGCTFSSTNSLFQCGFTDADLSGLEAASSASCTCGAESCDETPPLCIGDDPSPGSCEICDNGDDDDGNGLVDCGDPNCRHVAPCATTTTSTSSTTSSSFFSTRTYPDSTTTTSTTMLSTDSCRIRFDLEGAVTLGALEFDTHYDAAPGHFVGEGGNVECASLVAGSILSVNDHDEARYLVSGLISLDGIVGPTPVAECSFLSTVTPLSAGDFWILVQEAWEVNGLPASELPQVVIGNIDCGPAVDTTTTTTLEAPTTTQPAQSEPWIVAFRADSASSAVGALQFSVDYSSASGDFRGMGAAVGCTNKVAGALFAPNDKDAQHKLTLGFVALTPFAAPLDLATCAFDGTTAPEASDFVITVEDATDSDGNAIKAAVSASVAVLP